MSTLAIIASIVGGVHVALFGFALFRPSACRSIIESFPRSIWPARILLMIALPWAAWMLVSNPPLLGSIWLTKLVYIATPIAFVLIMMFVSELLAPRVLGGLLLLISNPILMETRFHDSLWRLVVSVMIYIWIVAGIMLVLHPYRFRQIGSYFLKNSTRSRMVGVSGLGVAALLFVLALSVY